MIGGYLSGSLAIMSDAAHMFSGKKIIKLFSNKLVRFDTCIMEQHVFFASPLIIEGTTEKVLQYKLQHLFCFRAKAFGENGKKIKLGCTYLKVEKRPSLLLQSEITGKKFYNIVFRSG